MASGEYANTDTPSSAQVDSNPLVSGNNRSKENSTWDHGGSIELDTTKISQISSTVDVWVKS